MQNPFGKGMLPLPPNFITMKNPKTGKVRLGKIGFSISSLIFHYLPAILRSDYYNLACMCGIDMIAYMAIVMIQNSMGIANDTAMTVTYVLTSILWGTIYNLMYVRHLHKLGYVPGDKYSAAKLYKHRYLKRK
ncbi:hypothetical protein [Apilactobacillus xinyiensis]|uniref:hypothetical protein n=2 Tax=Apilactobacillus xinyiensis TaxID=2841032 RepID=UPI00200BCB8A|nr:hypothetical protein [Apilactobacillus xinyiensis]MCL0318938.1 hypothetical protein [Apilactobacillus xinyiensis]